jgi:hypothetical protein
LNFILILLYPIVWVVVFITITIGLVLYAFREDVIAFGEIYKFYQYIYLLFGPRFQAIMICFTTGIVLNKVEKLDFNSTLKDIEFCKSFKYYLKENDWKLQYLLDYVILSNKFESLKGIFHINFFEILWESYSNEEEFIEGLNMKNKKKEYFISNVELENIANYKTKLENELREIFEEYKNSTYFKRSLVYFKSEIPENDYYIPLFYYILYYGIFKNLYHNKDDDKNLNIGVHYAKQLRNIFPNNIYTSNDVNLLHINDLDHSNSLIDSNNLKIN